MRSHAPAADHKAHYRIDAQSFGPPAADSHLRCPPAGCRPIDPAPPSFPSTSVTPRPWKPSSGRLLRIGIDGDPPRRGPETDSRPRFLPHSGPDSDAGMSNPLRIEE